MTTVAYRDGVLAADTLTTANGNVDGYLPKISRVGRVLVGFAGSIPVGLKFRQWVADGMHGDSPYEGGDTGNGLVVSDAGIVCWSGKGQWPVTTGYYALGSGSDIAMGAMEHGATAEEAVRIAARVNVDTGGEITVLRLDGKPQRELDRCHEGSLIHFDRIRPTVPASPRRAVGWGA